MIIEMIIIAHKSFFMIDLAFQILAVEQILDREYNFKRKFIFCRDSGSHVVIRSWVKFPRRYFFCGPFMFFSVLCLLRLCMRLFVCALWTPNGKGLTSWLSFVVSDCVFVTLPLVSWVRCGT